MLAQEPVVFWRVLRRKLGSSAGGDSLRFFVDFLKPEVTKQKFRQRTESIHVRIKLYTSVSVSLEEVKTKNNNM